MLHTMNVSYMERVCRNFIKANTVVDSQNSDGNFLKKMAAAYNQATWDAKDTQDTPVSAAVFTDGMTMEEYRQHIYDEISALPMRPDNMHDYIAVQISDAGFEAMKNDPEYEQWVLDTIRSNFMARDPYSGIAGAKYVVLSFGAQKTQARAECFRAGYLNGQGSKLFEKESKDSFWKRKMERSRQIREFYWKVQEEKELNKRLEQGMYYGELPILAEFKPHAT